MTNLTPEKIEAAREDFDSMLSVDCDEENDRFLTKNGQTDLKKSTVMTIREALEAAKRQIIYAQNKLKSEKPESEWSNGYMTAMNTIYRRNKSGCCCKMDDEDNFISCCEAHKEWADNRAKDALNDKGKDDGK